jgi:lipooligosaccharide transport system permease protein
MSAPTVQPSSMRLTPPLLHRFVGTGGARHLVERNARVYRREWLVLVSGFLEPVFYLFSIGVGVSKLVGDVTLPGGEVVTYTAFVAPAMLAASAMNGAIIDATFSLFFKLKYNKLYDAVLATPVAPVDVAIGEITWALMRGSLYSISFVGVMLLMGLISSWWAVLTIPAVVLTGYAFAAIGTACTTYMRSWQDFSYITLVQLPIFLFSATFYPLSVYPESLQWVVRCSPLYHAATLMRELTTGTVGLGSLVHVAVLVALGVVGMVVTGRRLEKLLLT